jgi:toluene monooxygenase system ferredoxin subunit
MLEQPKRIARASCVEKSVVMRLNGKDALRVLEADPASGFQVMRRLSNLLARYLMFSGVQ